jgi:UDP-N-acetylmuramoyl-tripeptide--D-alanyl-D-alanine ligase
MKELGEHGPEFHAALARPIEAAGVQALVLVGDEMAPLAEILSGKSLEGAIDFAHGRDVAEVVERVKMMIRPGDAILVKGSNSVGLSRIVAALTAGES